MRGETDISPSWAADDAEIRSLYERLIDGWNRRDAAAMAATFAIDGELIGFDGSQIVGQAEIVAHLAPIFADHPTAAYVRIVKQVRLIGPDVALLRAIAGLVPPGQSEIRPELNAHQTIVATRQAGGWRIALFQNTPAQFHGRPELVQAMTEELRQALPRA